MTLKAKVYKNLEIDERFKNNLQKYLYFRLWGYRDNYRPLIGNVTVIKKLFNLPQSKKELRKELNYLFSSKLIYVFRLNRVDKYGDQLFIIGANYIGERIGEYYYMYPNDTLKEKFIFKDKEGLLNTNCEACPKYDNCSDCIDCINVLMEKLYEYENK